MNWVLFILTHSRSVLGENLSLCPFIQYTPMYVMYMDPSIITFAHISTRLARRHNASLLMLLVMLERCISFVSMPITICCGFVYYTKLICTQINSFYFYNYTLYFKKYTRETRFYIKEGNLKNGPILHKTP